MFEAKVAIDEGWDTSRGKVMFLSLLEVLVGKGLIGYDDVQEIKNFSSLVDYLTARKFVDP